MKNKLLATLLLIVFFLFSSNIELILYDLRLYISSVLKKQKNDDFIIINYDYNYIGNSIVLIKTIDKLIKAKAIVIDSTLIKYDNNLLNLLYKIKDKNNIFITKEYIYKNDNLYLFSSNYFDNITGVTNYNNTVREYKKVHFNTLENKLETSIEFILYQKFYKAKETQDFFKIKYILAPNQVKNFNFNDLNENDFNKFENKIVFLSYSNNYVYFPFIKTKFLQSELIINNIISLENNIYIKRINFYFEVIICILFIFLGYKLRKNLRKTFIIFFYYTVFNFLLFVILDIYINIVYVLLSLISYKTIIQNNMYIINKFNFSNKIKSKNEILTILFCDIEDFTLITEKLSNQKLLEILNEFLNIMTEVIINNNGNLDKYIGDGFMAFFKDPIDCIKASISMYNELENLQKKWLELGIKPFQMRIGISTGEVILANIGHNSKIQSTLIGDAVNLASRLEKLNKEYNTSILVSKSTYEKIKNSFNTKFIGTTNIKGKSEKVDIYEVKV